ncbi:MAG: hypothetical protein AAGF73_11705 [Actinomycetota bacterium]
MSSPDALPAAERRVQYRIVVAKKDERVTGDDDAEVVFTVPAADVTADDFDATVAFMRGVLKAAGPSGAVLAALKSGGVDRSLAELATTI